MMFSAVEYKKKVKKKKPQTLPSNALTRSECGGLVRWGVLFFFFVCVFFVCLFLGFLVLVFFFFFE